MRTASFDYELPPELIAQEPAPERDRSRLLVLDRATGSVAHLGFGDLEAYLQPGDALVLNDSRVIPARLRAANPQTGTVLEILLLEEQAPGTWHALMRPARKARLQTRLQIQHRDGRPSALRATVVGRNDEGHRFLRFEGADDIRAALAALGDVPLPPYIRRPGGSAAADAERYQTVYAAMPGSVAAPTAGLHFTGRMLDRLRGRGIGIGRVTLHVGLATFAPVKTVRVADHPMHAERYELPETTARLIRHAKAAGRRVVAVGTTSVRVLETAAAASPGDGLAGGSGRTDLFIYPPWRFRVVDALLTNFHLPRSTLLMLVSAFAAPGEVRGTELVLRAYAEAVRRRYRFYSYGDAMLVL
ncbi:MAG: tRNA preQ1(34) S-adenosylmethionine ribosyltransferase-isomerase QueA [Verrucomicrobia bacterium]|nr:tRNA preQ1(34) S-adenosylmethionine ribosyltransferase-isomerase QueA [Verrucomicrobiota bacterium]